MIGLFQLFYSSNSNVGNLQEITEELKGVLSWRENLMR